MKKLGILTSLLLLVALMGGTASAAPGGKSQGKGAAQAQGQNAKPFRTMVTHLTGAQEVPPHETDARGTAVFHLNRGGTSISYHLVAMNIEDVVAGHIHTGTVGINGPVVVTLVTPQNCRTVENGIVCKGTFDASALSGPLAGHPLSDLLTIMREGRAYVNVHTTAFPAGLIRGQLGRHGR